MRSLLLLFSLLCAYSAIAQLLPDPLQLRATRYGSIVPAQPPVFHEPPFVRNDRSHVDSIFQCEEMTWQYPDTTRSYSQCEYSQWPYPDTAIIIHGGTTQFISVPFFGRSARTEYYRYTALNDSVWIAVDSSRSLADKQKWYLDKNGVTRKVELLTSNDSLMATYYYKWHGDGRIHSVTAVGAPYGGNIGIDTLLVSSGEYIYDEQLRLRAYCTHTGRPYSHIVDSVATWSMALQKIYRDSFQRTEHLMVIPPWSSLTSLVVYNYSGSLLTDVFHCGQFSIDTDSIFYDENQLIDRTRSYSNGIKQSVTEFEYDSRNRVRRIRTIRYLYGYRPDIYTMTYEYGALGKISNIVLPPDRYNSTLVRHAYHLNYKHGN